MDLNELVEQSANRIRLPSEQEREEISGLAQEMLDLQNELDELEKLTIERKQQLALIQEVKLPDALERTGVKEVVLTNGLTLVINEKIFTSISAENQEAAFKWLKETENDGIIKNEVKCDFAKGQEEDATALMSVLTSQGFSYSNKKSVHPSTLKAFITKRLQNGESTPTDIFSIFVKKIADLKLPKRK